jgi:PhnB protein
MANVKPIPDGYSTVTPYLFIKGAAAAIEYYKKVFGAQEIMHLPAPGGLVGHAELKIGNSVIMLSDENPQWGTKGPHTLGGSATSLHVYVENVDSVVQKALAEGAQLHRPVKDQFYGDRSGSVVDPFGHLWSIATHIEDVSPEEIEKRMAVAMSQSASG